MSTDKATVIDARKVFLHRNLERIRDYSLLCSVTYIDMKDTRKSKVFNAIAQQSEKSMTELLEGMTDSDMSVLLKEIKRQYKIKD